MDLVIPEKLTQASVREYAYRVLRNCLKEQKSVCSKKTTCIFLNWTARFRACFLRLVTKRASEKSSGRSA